MNESLNNEMRVTQFAQIAHNFQKNPSKQFGALEAYSESILELRSKGASFATIASLLKRIEINVAADTIRRFYHCTLEERAKAKPAKRSRKNSTSSTEPKSKTSTAKDGAAQIPATSKPPAFPSPPAEIPRSRGPRIADPSKL